LNDRLKILKDIINYSSSALISQALAVIAGFWVARILGPADYGIWNAVSLVLVYGAYSEFGILSAMGRDLPFYQGKGDQKMTASIEGAARHSTFLGSLFAAFVTIIVSFLPGQPPMMALGLRVMAIILILQQIYTYHRIVLRSYNHFGELSRQQIVFALLTAVLSVIGVTVFGFEGRLIAAVFASVAILFYAVHRNPWRPVPKFNASVSWSLMRVGMPILISGFVLSLLTTVDRLMVITFLDAEQLGYLGLALMVTNVVCLIPGMASQVLYPRITYHFGNADKNVAALRPYVLNPPVILSLLLPLVIGPVYLILPFVISVFLPAYTPGITAARLIVIGVFFYSVIGLSDYFLVTIGKLKQYILFGCIALVFNIVLDYLFIRIGYGIKGIAIAGTLLTYFFYSCIVIGYALSHYTRQLLDWVRYFFQLWIPFVFMIALLWFVEVIMANLIPSISRIELLFTSLSQVLFFLIGYLPLLYIRRRDLKMALNRGNSSRDLNES
jgi:O-antigen/teichoic acid export membrane protein